MSRVSSRVCVGAAALLAMLGSLSGCRESSRAPRELSTFEGVADVETGTLTLRQLTGDPTIAAVFGPIDVDKVAPVGGPSQSDHAIQLVTNWAAYTDLAGHSVGTRAPPEGCGRRGSFCGNVTIRSFFKTQELHSVYVEIMDVYPTTGHVGFGSTAVPTTGPAAGQVGAAYGLWAYPALLDANRAAGSAPGANAAARTWYFDNFDGTSFVFHARIMADTVDVAPGVSGYQGTCWANPPNDPGVARYLDTSTDCGECGKMAEQDCTYGTTSTATLDFDVNCDQGLTACDSRTATAWDCVNTSSDDRNCGACGQACSAPQTCQLGRCVTPLDCTPGSSCGTGCCPVSSTCQAGECILTGATEVSVGQFNACAVTGYDQRPASAWSQVPGPTTSNNVVCWGTAFLDSVSSREGIPLPEGIPRVPGGLAVQIGNVFGLSGTLARTEGIAGQYYLYQWEGYPPYLERSDPYSSDLLTQGGSVECRASSSHADPFLDGAWCWGNNTFGQLGTGNANPNLFCSPFLGCPVAAVGGGASGLYVSAISAGLATVCAIVPDGKVACWGDNRAGEAGQTSGQSFASPQTVHDSTGANLTGATAISVGDDHAVALLGSSTLAVWGDNTLGQFGDGSTEWTVGVPHVFAAAGPVQSISAGQDFTCYVSGGAVYCAGWNNRGQLGDGTTTDRRSFVQVKGLSGAVAVSAGGVGGSVPSACALTASGTVYCWGDDSFLQLGDGVVRDPPAQQYSTLPVLVRLKKVLPN